MDVVYYSGRLEQKKGRVCIASVRMLFWMRPESHVAAAKIVRSSRRCLIGASSILHRTTPPADTRRVELQQGLDALLESLLHSFVERHFRSSARWSRSDFSWSPDTMPWTPSGASPSADHWAQQMPVSSVVASRRSCPTTPSRAARARARPRRPWRPCASSAPCPRANPRARPGPPWRARPRP